MLIYAYKPSTYFTSSLRYQTVVSIVVFLRLSLHLHLVVVFLRLSLHLHLVSFLSGSGRSGCPGIRSGKRVKWMLSCCVVILKYNHYCYIKYKVQAKAIAAEIWHCNTLDDALNELLQCWLAVDLWQWCGRCIGEPGMPGSAALWWHGASLQPAAHSCRGCCINVNVNHEFI